MSELRVLLASYTKALNLLTKFVKQKNLNDLEQQGLVHTFECVYERAWHLLQEYFESKGMKKIHGSRDAITLAVDSGLVDDQELWFDMLSSRVQANNAYDGEILQEIIAEISGRYIKDLTNFKTKMSHLIGDSEMK